MLIRSTPHICFVILRNGLTLELCYDQNLVSREPRAEYADDAELFAERAPPASQGVWMFHEEVLFEVRAGQA